MPNQRAAASEPVFDYEPLLADFNHKLNTQLRGHGADSDYLEAWVPDEDPVKSILNMAESAIASGCAAMKVRFAAATMDEAQRRALVAAVQGFAEARIAGHAGGYELSLRAKG